MDKIFKLLIIRRKIMRSLMGWLVLFLSISLFTYCRGTKAGDIAIYSDQGAWEESVQAGQKMFEWMGYTVAIIDADYINSQSLDKFRILYIPGGDMYQYAQDISSTGKEKIREFVANGGGYIGICGGAYFASEKVIWRGQELSMTPLGLFSGTTDGPKDVIVPYPEYDMSKINIENNTHPITQSEPDSVWILYYWGPILLPDHDANVTVLGRYDVGNYIAMLAFEYGRGRVFIIGTHPEIEEDSDRDGVEFGDDLDDHGSDWDLVREAVIWCLNE
jgi:glutamine amidotransferase-like uncharacterized protein